MPSGDALSLFWSLVFFAGGTGVTAYSVTGAKSRNLWVATAVISALAVAYFFFSAKIGISAPQAFQLAIAATPLLTVSLVVILLRDKREQTPTKKVEPAPPMVPASPQVQAQQGPSKADITLQVNRARRAGREAVASRSSRAMEKALAEMEAALLTLQKKYGLRTPEKSGKAKLDLETWERFLDEIWQFVRYDHIEEAREKAAAISAVFDAQLPDINKAAG